MCIEIHRGQGENEAPKSAEFWAFAEAELSDLPLLRGCGRAATPLDTPNMVGAILGAGSLVC